MSLSTPLASYLSDAQIEADSSSELVGKRNAAIYLSRVPFSARALCVRDATRQRNMTGMRYSDAVWSAVQAWERGALTIESYIEQGERFREMGY